MVRNFWIEAEVDGRKTPIAFGPRGKDGGFSLTVFMRNKDEAEVVLGIGGWMSEDGKLCLSAVDKSDGIISIERER